MNVFFSKLNSVLPQNVRNIVILGVCARLMVFLAVLFLLGPQAFLQSDSNNYLLIARNILNGNGFSLSEEAPFLPDSIRMPIYPLLIAGSMLAFNSYLPLIFLQILLMGIVIYLTWDMAMIISGRQEVARLAAILMAFEPLSVFLAVYLLTEALFMLVLTFAVWLIIRFLNTSLLWQISLGSFMVGAATLIRPISQFFPLVIFSFALTSKNGRWVKSGLVLFSFLLAVSPWLVRNYAAYGTFGLTSGGLQNFYSDYASMVVSIKENVPTFVAKERLEEDYARRHNISVEEIQQDINHSGNLFKEGLRIVFANPVAALQTQTLITIAFFTHDGYTYYLQRWGIIPFYDTTFSPSLWLAQKGMVATAQKIIRESGPYLMIAIAGRMIWFAFFMLALFGFWKTWREDRSSRAILAFLAATVVYFLIATSSTGHGVNGRYRFPIHPVFFVLVSCGIMYIKHQFFNDKKTSL